MRLTAPNTTDTDTARAYRCLLAWLDGDQLAFDVTLAEVMRDPVGTPGLLFTMIDLAATFGEKLNPDLAVRLRAELLRLEEDRDQG